MPSNWRGPRQREVTIEDLQPLFSAGGYRENCKPIAYLVLSKGSNVGSAYAKDMTYLGDFGWRPHDRRHAKYGGLFLC